MMATDVLSSELWREVVARVDTDPDALALFAGEEAISYGRLQQLVAERRDQLSLTERSLVLLHGRPSLDWVVAYLALLAGGHVPLLAGANHAQLAARWEPDAIVGVDDGLTIMRSPARGARELHPDLALALSTSGSTGSPKLVRLSHRNLLANAQAIVSILGLTAADRGITSLPLHYCYGLSVLHSHLVAGASVVLTDASVVDPCFRAAMRDRGVTNLAGVPHTYALLERVGPQSIAVPSLRLLTQAGGRMAPDDVVRWSHRAREWGASLVVMYGQTEATARIAYLPPELSEQHPDAVGLPVPGSSLRLQPIDGAADGVGELVVRGPHVMMGYAENHDDLARGSELDELFTGDLARRDPTDGVITIVGRRSRFVKPLGLRIDLDHVQSELRCALAPTASATVEAAVTGDDERIAVAVVGAPAHLAREHTCALSGLPLARVVAVELDALPRTDSGKVDYDAVAREAPALAVTAASASAADAVAMTDAARQVAAVYGTVLGVPAVRATDSFVSLGGDSLSYIECSIRLESVLGRLPDDWHLQPVGALEPGQRRRLARLDTTVVLRAVAICLVVGTHMGVFHLPGGAHTLLAVVGYNLARFMGAIGDRGARVRAGLRTAARVAVPAVMWIAAGIVIFRAYSGGTLLLINNYIGPESHRGAHWHFWFFEVFTHLVLLVSLLLAVPAVRRIERRQPYWCALGAFAVTLVLAMDWSIIGDAYNQRFRTHGVAFYFFAGWLVAQSIRLWQRIATTALLAFALPWFFDHSDRDRFILASVLGLLWAAEVPLPRLLVRPLSMLAAASMWILITHFTLWPIYVEHLALLHAYAATLASGVLVALTVTWATRAIRGVPQFHRNRRPAGGQACSPAALVA